MEDNVEIPEPEPEPEETFTPEEIASAEKDLADLEKYRNTPAQPAIDYDQFANKFGEAIKPLIPKAPDPVYPWQTDNILESREALIKGVQALYEHHRDQYHKEKIEPLQKELENLKVLMPEFFAYVQENPTYAKINERANELVKHGMPRVNALNFAKEEVKKSVAPTGKPPIPKHMSSPDTRSGGAPDNSNEGAKDFRGIIAELRASGKF